MFRYISFLWDPSNPATIQTAANFVRRLGRDYTTVLNTAGMHVACAGIRAGVSEIHPLPGIDGVVLGTVFDTIKPGQVAPATKKHFSIAEAQQVVRSDGKCLQNICWGRYVAVLRGSRGNCFAFRDPIGALPCFLTAHRGVDICFSYMEDCVNLGGIDFSINWDFIAARTVRSILYARETAITEISEVLPGELVQVPRTDVSSRSLVWDPFQVAQADPIEDAETAASELRRVGRASIQGWADRYGGILLQLSGGLDSSIVLSCLRDLPSSRLTCLNYHSVGSNSDERAYARLAATHAGSRLIERERKRDVNLADMLRIDRSPAPSFYLAAAQIGRSEAELATTLGADAIFTGGGGDQLFYQARAELAAADYFALHGVDRRMFRIALDVARIEHSSIWRVLWTSAVLAHRGLKPFAEGIEDRKLVNSELIDKVSAQNRFRDPRFDRASTVPPGKLWHALTLSFPTEYYDPVGQPNDPEQVQPLLCQPLVELCLRIPSYVLTRGAWDRAIARRAFANDVPDMIIRRRSKGGMEENVEDILIKNIELARELLLNGNLAKRRFLDRSKLEEILSLGPTQVVGAMTEIFDHLSTEAWLQRWQLKDSESSARTRAS